MPSFWNRSIASNARLEVKWRMVMITRWLIIRPSIIEDGLNIVLEMRLIFKKVPVNWDFILFGVKLEVDGIYIK